MKTYLSITGNNNGAAFPGTRAVDATGPLAIDGTEFIKEVVDDVWLNRQAELDFYSYPPNGMDDVAGVNPANGLPWSQPLAARYMNYGTPGKVVSWASAKDPIDIFIEYNIDLRLLMLEGQGIDRTLDDYKVLDFIVYTGDGNNLNADSFYHADDAAGTIRNTAGDYLILPDMRGYFLRFEDPTGTIDPDGVSRVIGDVQDDSMQRILGHFLALRTSFSAGADDEDVIISEDLESGPYSFTRRYIQDITISERSFLNETSNAASYFDRINFDSDAVTRTDVESRSKNIIVRPAIYY